MVDESQPALPSALPPGITLAFHAAVDATGWTAALIHAAAILPKIMRMSAAEFERRSAELYQRTDM